MNNDKRIDPPSLTDLMVKECGNRGIMTQQMCDELDISKTYFVSLVNGHKETQNISTDNLRKIAKFLRRSLVEVELIAGAKTPEDFFGDGDLDDSLITVFRMMNADPSVNQFASFSVRDWNALPQYARVLIAVLYENKVKKGILIRPNSALVGTEDQGKSVKKPKTKTA